MNGKIIQTAIQSVSQRGIYTVSAVTYCNHMLIIPSCTKIVPAHSICSSLSLFLFTGFSFFLLHFFHPNGPDYSIPPLCTGFFPLFSKLLLIFFLITFPPNDLFHSAYWVHDALHRLWEPLRLCQGSLSLLLFLSSSVHLCSPKTERERVNKWARILDMQTHSRRY